MENVKIKRGDTADFSATLTDSLGAAITGKATNLKCQFRDVDGNLVKELTVSESDTPGTYIFRAGDTSGYPAGEQLYCDIQYTDADGIVSSTDTFSITVREDVTIA